MNTNISLAAKSRQKPPHPHPFNGEAPFLRKLTSTKTPEEWQKLADRRSSPAADRLCAGIFLLYHRATGAQESDCFLRDAETWNNFEQAALPEMDSFAFFDRSQNISRTPNSVLADAMGDIWMAEKLPNITGQPNTLEVVTILTKHICAHYEITAIERRTRKRASLGLDILA
jgi:hypothetical protein